MDLGGLADKAKNALNSDKGEQQSDSALDKAAEFADQDVGTAHPEFAVRVAQRLGSGLLDHQRPVPQAQPEKHVLGGR